MLHSRNSSRRKVHNHQSMYETSLPYIYSHNVPCAYLWSWGLQFGEDAVLLIYKSLIGWETKLLQNLAILDLAAGEQRMVEVGGVCDDDAGSAMTASVNNVMEGWKRSPCDLLCSPHHSAAISSPRPWSCQTRRRYSCSARSHWCLGRKW